MPDTSVREWNWSVGTGWMQLNRLCALTDGSHLALSPLSLWAQLKTAFSFFYCPCCLSLPQRLVEGRAPAGQVALLFTVNSNSSTWGTDQEVWIVITLPADGHLCCVALTVCKYEGSPDGSHGLCRCRAPAPFVIGVEFKGKKHKKNMFFLLFSAPLEKTEFAYILYYHKAQISQQHAA